MRPGKPGFGRRSEDLEAKRQRRAEAKGRAEAQRPAEGAPIPGETLSAPPSSGHGQGSGGGREDDLARLTTPLQPWEIPHERRVRTGLMIFMLLATIPAAILRLTQDGPALCSALAGPLGALTGALLRRSLLSLKDRALLTGWLLGLALPASAGPALAALAGARHRPGQAPFGGLGRNPFSPAMVGYASLLMLFPLASVDGLSGATPLAAFASREGLTVSSG